MIEFARGCKFKCLYCNYPVLGVKEDHTRDASNVKDQMLKAYDRFGIENYVVSDETFNDSTEKIIKFADVIETLPWKPYLSGYIRADLLISRKQDREHLLRMGFLGHFYGIETFNEKSGKIIGKGMHPDRVKEGLIEIKKFFNEHRNKKFRAIIALIAGLPHETTESLENTRQWIKKNWLDQVVMTSVLEIGNLEKEYRPSELALDYKKYGYRKIKEDSPKIKEAFESMIKHSSFGSIAWENDNMDIIQAYNWHQQIDKLWTVGSHDLGRLDPFYLSNILVKKTGQLLSLEEKLALTNTSSADAYLNFPNFIEEYKTKKLSI